MQRKRRFKRVIWILVGLVGVYGLTVVVLANQYLRPVPLPSGPPPAYLSETLIPHADYEIPTWVSEGLASESGMGRVYVLVHGYGGRRDEMVSLADELKETGEIVIPAMAGLQTVITPMAAATPLPP